MSEGIDLETAHKTLLKSYQRYLPEQLNNNFIFQSIVGSKNQQSLLFLYGNLTLDRDQSLIMKLMGLKSYLMIILTIFLTMSFTAYTFTIPVFTEIFEQWDTPLTQIENFYSYWIISLVLILSSSVSLILFTDKVKQIQNSSSPNQFSIYSKILLSAKIVNQIYKSEALTYSPLGKKINQYSPMENKLFTTLHNDNLNTKLELSLLINEQYFTLSQLINKRLKLFISLISAFIVIAIFNFLYSLYTPIFAIGTVQ